MTASADAASAFNSIGSRAVELSYLMSKPHADAFDAVMEDIMAALLSFPEMALRDRANPATIKPARPSRIEWRF